MRDSTRTIQKKTDRITWVLITFYFFVATLEIYAEHIGNRIFIYAVKPLIIPTLLLIYCRTSEKPNFVYLTALCFSWIANIFFINQSFASIFTGAVFFFFYRLLSIYVVFRHIRLPGIFPVVIGSMPFLFVYLYLVNITYDMLGDGLIIFVVQCLIISLLGGLSVGNFMLRFDRISGLLLISTMLFAVTQFIFVLRLYYVGENVFQPLAMLFFVAAQFIFYRFLILSEREAALSEPNENR